MQLAFRLEIGRNTRGRAAAIRIHKEGKFPAPKYSRSEVQSFMKRLDTRLDILELRHASSIACHMLNTICPYEYVHI